jgi:YihY family inner membrane protein
MSRFSHLYSRFIDTTRQGWPRVFRGAKFVWDVLVRVIVKYNETDGEQRAASFAYYAFFSLFPLLLLLISIGAMLLGDDPLARQHATTSVVNFVKGFIPVVVSAAPPPVPEGAVPPPDPDPTPVPVTSATPPGPEHTIYTITLYPPGAESVSWDTEEFKRTGNSVEFKTLSTNRLVTVTGNFVIVQKPEGQADWFVNTFDGVVRSRNKAGLIAFLALAWSAIRFFQALVHGVNKAWGTKEYAWWRLPIQNLFMAGIVGSALFLGVVIPPIINLIEYYFWAKSNDAGLNLHFFKGIFAFARATVPSIVLFYGFSMLYKFAPRRRTTFREVWFASLVVTLGLQGLQNLFVIYSTNIGEFNRLYGTLGSVIALLMWIYLTGTVIILGGCISAATYEVRMSLTDQSEPSTAS